MKNKIAAGVITTFVALLAVITACSKGTTGIGEGLPPATYTLRTINGQNVPLTAAIKNGVRIEILDGTFKIESTSRFTSSATYRRTETNGAVSTSVENCVGTYNVSNSTTSSSIIFTELGSQNANCGVQLGAGGRDRNYTGTWDGANTLTVDFDITTHSVFTK